MSFQRCNYVSCFDSEDDSNEKLICSVCSSAYHQVCANITDPELVVIKGNPHIVWNCANCLQSSMRDSTSALLKCTLAVTDMLNKFGPILESVAKQNMVPKQPVFNVGTPKRSFASVTEGDDLSDRGQHTRKVAKINKIDVRFGTKDSGGLVSVPLKTATRRPTTDTLENGALRHIYLSRLLTSTSEEEITNYIKSNADNVNGDLLECRKLIPRGKSLEELRFISFKISVANTDYDRLVNPDFWTKGVAVREFQKLPATQNATFLGNGSANPVHSN